MKILIVGSDKVFAIENFYVKYLREMSLEIFHFPAPTIFSNYYQRSKLNKILFRSGISGIYKRINGSLLQYVEEQKPEIMWVFKGMEIFPETIQCIRSKKIKLINYNPDNPFLFSGRGSGNKNITGSLPYYDFYFTYNLEIKQKLETQFSAQAGWLPFGFDVRDSLLKECEAQEEIIAACFLGNPDADRANFIHALADQGISITVYGLHWTRFIQHPLVKNAGPVYGDELVKVLRKYRVQLNLMRPHNLESHNMRTFEVPGIGGIMLAPDTPEHRTFFDNEKEIFLFKDVRDCANKINSLLSLPVSKANQIRQRARARSIASGYTYKDRAHQVAKVLQSL